ncbi:MAG: PAS domain S-box protein [Rubrivivax sp.]|nr:PAS domain S-box protein [Rubrivivax sp.]
MIPDPLAGAPLDATLLRAMLDAIPARVVAVDAGHRVIDINAEGRKFTRLPREMIVGQHLSAMVGPALYEATYRPLHERIFERRETVRLEHWVDYPHIGRRYVQEHFFPYVTGSGPVQAAFVFVRDLTELKVHEVELADKVRALQATESLKAAIVDHAQAAVVVADDQDRLVEFNPAAEAMFGYARDEVVGRTAREMLVPERLRAIYAAAMASLRQGDPYRLLGRRLQRVAMRKDGSEFPIEAVVWVTSVGGAAYTTATVTDLTASRAAAEQIERQRDQLRQSEKLSAMGSLLAGVAHELNNPLAIVMGRASLLEDRAEGTEMQADARRIREAAERCGRIVRTFLNMARSRPMEKRAVQLNDLVRAAAEMLNYTLKSHAIDASLQLDPTLPELQADADQLGQVVLNLLVNAQHAVTAHDGPKKRIVLATRVDGGEAVLSVSDSGAGVPAELAERIFEPFFSTKPEGSGTGLGLSVSRSIAREHGGSLALALRREGDRRQGARFELRLPLRDSAAAAPAAGTVTGSDAAATGASARLLVVDDEPEIVDLVRTVLEAAGHRVTVASSGVAALQRLREARFDAIVSDLRMPDLDGAELWRAVRVIDPVLARRMIFVTGDTLSPGASAFLGDTGNERLDKPFRREALLAAVQRTLARRGEERT